MGAGPVPLKTRMAAIAMLVFWAVAVTAGRFTAYSSYVRKQSAVAVLIAAFLMLARQARRGARVRSLGYSARRGLKPALQQR